MTRERIKGSGASYEVEGSKLSLRSKLAIYLFSYLFIAFLWRPGQASLSLCFSFSPIFTTHLKHKQDFKSKDQPSLSLHFVPVFPLSISFPCYIYFFSFLSHNRKNICALGETEIEIERAWLRKERGREGVVNGWFFFLNKKKKQPWLLLLLLV
jgi:hypothetical protein